MCMFGHCAAAGWAITRRCPQMHEDNFAIHRNILSRSLQSSLRKIKVLYLCLSSCAAAHFPHVTNCICNMSSSAPPGNWLCSADPNVKLSLTRSSCNTNLQGISNLLRLLNHSMHTALEETVHNSAATAQCEIQSAWISVGNLKVQSCRVRAVWVAAFGL